MKNHPWILIWGTFVLLLIAVAVFGQTASIPGDRLAWDQPAANLAEAQSYSYRGYFDGANQGQQLTATCAGQGAPFQCFAAIPPLPTGNHTVQLSASVTLPQPDGRIVEGARSTAFSFRIFAGPPSPANIRIAPAP